MIEFSRFFNDAVNDLLARGWRTYKAEREALALALAAATVRKCTPKPADWDLP